MSTFFRFLLLLFVALPVLFFTSCAPSLPKYGMLNSGTYYLPKPQYNDTAKSALYARAAGSFGSYGSENWTYLTDAMICFSHTGRDGSIAAGLTGFMGTIELNKFPEFKGKKGLYGLALSVELAGRMGKGVSDVRWPGLKFSYVQEFGKYSQFRKEAAQKGLVENIHDINHLMSLSLTFETSVIRDDHIMGLQFYPGISVGGDRVTGHFVFNGYIEYRRFRYMFQLNLENHLMLTGGIYFRLANPK